MDSIEWHINSKQHQMTRTDFRTQEQLALFESIRLDIDRSESIHPPISVVVIVPWMLFLCLTYFGERGDLWRPISLTGICLALIEFWLKVNA